MKMMVNWTLACHLSQMQKAPRPPLSLQYIFQGSLLFSDGRSYTHSITLTRTAHRSCRGRAILQRARPWSVIRASGIIKCGPTGSFGPVGLLTLSCWLAASITTDGFFFFGGWPVSGLADHVDISGEVWRARCRACFATYSQTTWPGSPGPLANSLRTDEPPGGRGAVFLRRSLLKVWSVTRVVSHEAGLKAHFKPTSK